MTQSFNQAFEQIRSAIPNNATAVVMYRRRLPGPPHEDEIATAFHDSATTANLFFDLAEALARNGKSDIRAAVLFARWPGRPRQWAVADDFDLDPIH